MKYAEASVFSYADLSVYRLDIPADLPETSTVEGGRPGQTVVFKLGGGEASQANWQEGGVRHDLSASLGPDLSLAIDDGRTATSPGNTLTYTITVVNHGPGPASGVTIRDTLPPATTFVSASDGGIAAGGVVTWPAFEFAEGESAVRTVTVEVLSTVPADLDTITNTGTVSDDGTQGLDPHPENNAATDADVLDALADLSVDVSINGGFSELSPGQRIDYFVDVANRGSRDARGVTVRSTLPEGVTLLVASDGGSETGGAVTWPRFDLAAGSSMSRILTLVVNRPLTQSVESLEVTAEAQHSGTDANPSDNSASLVTPVLQRPDLTVVSVDPAGTTTDPQSLAISGSVTVEIANDGNLDVLVPFSLVIFEDRNGDGVFSASTDNQLGQAPVNDPTPGAERVSVDVPVSGTVLFRDNRIFAFADSGLAIGESDESNNVGHTGQACDSVPTPGSFNPVVELSWPGASVIEPRSKESLSTPLVVNLTDDNGDGRIDAGDVPDLVFVTSELQDITGTVPVLLRAIRGDTGAAIWNIPGFFLGGERVTFALSGQAAGDIDGDGLPEIVTSTVDLLPPYTAEPVNRLIAYEHNGARKWISGFYSCRPNGGPTTRDNPYIADLDADGQPEIIVGALVFDRNGNLRWQGTGGQAYQSNSNAETHLSGCTSIVADLDLFGPPELVTGNTAYYSDGSIYWQVDQDDGYPAVGNFDDDPYPEIVVVAKGRVRLMEHDGTLIWGPNDLPGTKPVAGGAPTIADFDADGEPEIGVASSDLYVVYETDGSVKWQRSTQDRTSNMTGSTVFDLDGDGRFEVIYRDERKLRIYRGEDGTVLFEHTVSSNTHNEEPVVADVDGDGNAEIVVTSDLAPAVSNIPNSERTFGLRVFGDADDHWVGTRGIWNQHAYSGVNVRDDSAIPVEPEWSWLTHNTYRAQVATERQTFAAPDISVSRVSADLSNYPAIRITVRVGNGGDALAKTGLPVAFYGGNPASGGNLLGTASVSKALKPGEYEDLVFTFMAADFNARTVFVAADDDGTGRGRESECDEENNRTSATYDAAFLGLTLAISDGQTSALEGETITYTLTVFNATNQTATGVALTDTLPAHTTLVAAEGGGVLANGVVRWPLFSLGSGATATRSLTVRVNDPVPTTVTEIVNQAAVTDDGSQGPDPTPANNSAVDSNRIATLRADAGGPYAVDEGVAVTFDASGSRNRVGTIVSYAWDLDADGAFDDGIGVRVTRTFLDETSLTVAVQVRNSANETSTDTASLTVRNVAPVVEAGPDRKVARGGTLALTATTFTDLGTKDTHTATIDWGDGSPVQAGAVTESQGAGKVSGSHVYPSNGRFPVKVCVADTDGGSACDSFLVDVGNGWVLNGYANDVVRPGCIRFTDGTWNQGGTAWYTERLDLTESFDKTFRVYLGSSSAGVDGLTFTLQNAATGTSSMGAFGGYLGYRGIVPSVAVEIDIFPNRGYAGDPWPFVDPDENHLAVNESGTLDHRGHPAVKLPSVENGVEHLLRVIWNAPARTLDVHLNGIERLMYSKDLVEQIFGGVSEVYWGLTAASGHGSAEQYFCETAACEPGVTPAISVGDVQVTELETSPVVASFPVTLSCAADHEVRIDAATADGSALAGVDYEAVSKTLVFAPGATSQAIEVAVLGDGLGEPTEQLFLDLSRPQGGAIRYSRGIGTIRDDRPPTIQLTGTIRDFKVEHPDFEVALPADPGIVLPTLGPDRKPVYAGQAGNPTTSGQVSFDQWFRDVPGVNRAKEFSIALQARQDDPRVFRYSNRQFFVIDGELFGNQGYSHNNHFTYELHTQFLYEGGEVLRFFSDDDMWVFINGRLALDMGGCTCQQKAIQVDARAAELGITRGGFYDMDIFYAERHSGGATFEMETTFSFTNASPGLLQFSSPVYDAGESGAFATITVTREGGSEGQVAVSYSTADGTATAPADYGAVSGTVTFRNGEVTPKKFTIPIIDDSQVEGDETVQVALFNPTGGAALGLATAALSLRDDDTVAAPELTATKRDELAADHDGDGVPSPGDELLYTVRITNSGGSSAHDVVLTDAIPDHTHLVAGSVSTSAGTVVTEDPVQVEIGQIGAGATVAVTFHVMVDDPVPAGILEVSNQGAVTSRELPAVLTDDPDLGGASDSTVTMIAAAPMLVAEKSDTLAADADGDGSPSPGDTIEYRISILNNGNTSATDVVLEDAIPAHTTLAAGSVEASTGTVESEDPVRVSIDEIAGGERVEVTFRVEIENPIATGVREVSNQGTVTSAELPAVRTDDPEAGGSEVPTVTAVSAAPALRVEKTDLLFEDADGDGVASPGDAVLYRIIVTNTGNTGASGVVLTDLVPANASLVNGTVQTSQGTVESVDPVRVGLGELAAGATVTVSFQVRIDAAFPHTATELSNQATVESRELKDMASDDSETPETADPTRTPVFLTPDITIGDVAVDENAGQAVLSVTLSRTANREVRVSWATGAGSALAGVDFTASSGLLTFAPGETAKTLAVPVLDDLIDELDETFPVVLSDPAFAKIADAEVGVTIRDNDPAPHVSVADASVTEGDDGTVAAVFTVTLSVPSGLDVTVSYATADGTARSGNESGSDYQAASGTLLIPAGTVSRTVEVQVIGDLVDELDETFTLTLLNPVSAVLARASGAGTILDDDEARVAVVDAGIDEGNAGTVTLRLPVTLSTPSAREIRVDWSVTPGTATEGADYTAASGAVVFPAGATSQSVEVAVHGDLFLEPDEILFVDLAVSAGTVLEDGRGVGTIRDDEVCPGPELLINAGGESRGGADAIPGWTVVEGAWHRRTADPDPAEGTAYLAAGTVTPAELRQDVDVSAYADRIAVGDQLFRFSGFLRTAVESPSDVARVVVEYRDASNAVVLDAFDTGEIASPSDWRPVFDERPAPAGTGWIRVRLYATRFTGTGNDAYFDGLSLVSLRAATVTLGDVTVYESHSGTTPAVFPVRLACPIDREITVTYATADGTARAGEDYLTTSGTLTFAAGVTAAEILVPVLGDDIHESHEMFRVLLGEASSESVVDLDRVGSGTIRNDDFCPRSPGFWKNHQEVWPVRSLEIGSVEYNEAGLLALLSYNGPDASNHLARQLVAAELNLLVGSDPSILPVVGEAHLFLAVHPPGSKPSGTLKNQANALKDRLDAYNNSPCRRESAAGLPGE